MCIELLGEYEESHAEYIAVDSSILYRNGDV